MPKVSCLNPKRAAAGARRGRRVSTSLSEINVIPLVDVMLVLLIIFMVAAPMLQKGVEVNLPVARRADRRCPRSGCTSPCRSPIARMARCSDEEDFVSRDVLPSGCVRRCQGKEQKEVFLRGDGGVQLQELMDVMDRLKKAA